MDEMEIKQQVDFDSRSGQVYGFTQFYVTSPTASHLSTPSAVAHDRYRRGSTPIAGRHVVTAVD